jgi:hypothetical protein
MEITAIFHTSLPNGFLMQPSALPHLPGKTAQSSTVAGIGGRAKLTPLLNISYGKINCNKRMIKNQTPFAYTAPDGAP